VKQKLFLILFLSSLVTACGQISSHAVVFPEPELYRLKPGELVLAASEGDISRNLLGNGIIDFESLTSVPAQLVYWFAWTGFYPESNLS
jgi:hypothetical protein